MSIGGYISKKNTEILTSPSQLRPFLIREMKLVLQLAFYLPKKNPIDAWIKQFEPFSL